MHAVSISTILFMKYLSLHGKSYSSLDEFEARKAHLIEVDSLIGAHNSSPSSYKLGHNQDSDLSVLESKTTLGQ